MEPEQGIVDLSYQLAPEATLGTYTVAVAEGKTFGTFSVEEYGRRGLLLVGIPSRSEALW